MFIGKYNKSVILTYVGAIAAVCGMVFAIKEYISYAIICMIVSVICDLFDGKVARACKRDEEEKEFGVEIDSLCDVLNFLALPAVIGIKLVESINALWAYPLIGIYVLCGIIRLAWFNLNSNSEGPVKYYIGLPTAYASLIYPILYGASLVFKFSFALPYIVIMPILSVLFILNFKMPKPKGIWYVIFSVLAVAVTALILVMG